MDTLFGIDFGSKLTGNTVIAIYTEQNIFFLDVDKGVDADDFILNAAEHFQPSKIFIDAPLSLPGVYLQINGFSDYHFRQADIELNAMSPMFLGGLAARAMELKKKLEQKDIQVFETYPRILAERLNLRSSGYKGSTLGLKDCRKKLINQLEDEANVDKSDIKTWHHLDSLLALMSALKYEKGSSESFGHQQEGLIYI